MKLIKLAICGIIAFQCWGVSFAQLDDLAEKNEKLMDVKTPEKEKDKDVSFSLHGYVQANFVVSRNNLGVAGNIWRDSKYELPRIGGTLQLELEGNAYDIAHFFSAVEIEYNAAGEKTNFPKFYYPNAYLQYTYFTSLAGFKKDEISKAPTIKVRETYVDLYGKGVTFRVGHQIISWGEIEGIEEPSNVVIPWDYTTMSNYFENSRLAVSAANLSFHFARQQLQFIWIPLFQPNKLPLESMYKRGATSISLPAFEIRNGEYAARLSGALGNQFRYGLGFLYGFDDQPDAKVTLLGNYQSLMGINIFMPSVVLTQMRYNRVMIPTLDMNIGFGETLSWKVSANANLTRDFWGKDDLIKNSTVTYLTGPESSNMFLKFYMGIYVGQQWVLNYSSPQSMDNPIKMVARLNVGKLPTDQILAGYGQQYPYKWMLSCNIQRSFMESDALDFQVRFALYADPTLKHWDYIVYPYFMYKFTNGVSSSLGFIFANRLGDRRTMLISETRYSF